MTEQNKEGTFEYTMQLLIEALQDARCADERCEKGFWDLERKLNDITREIRAGKRELEHLKERIDDAIVRSDLEPYRC